MNASPSLKDPHCIQYRPKNPGLSLEPHTDPEWYKISAGLHEPLDDTDQANADLRDRICGVLTAALEWITNPAYSREKDWQSLCGRRAIALAYELNPDAFGRSVSVHELARGLGIERTKLRRLGKQASAAFGLKPTNTKENQ